MANDTGQETTATTTGQEREFGAGVNDERVGIVAHPEIDGSAQPSRPGPPSGGLSTGYLDSSPSTA